MNKITAQQVFEWVKTGHWSLRDFNEWVTAQKTNAHAAGYTEGRTDAEYFIGEDGGAI